MQDPSPDHDERIRDFFDRHGGPGKPVKEVQGASGAQGWSEIYAKDGYTLHCEWSREGSRAAMQYSERAP